MAAAARWAIRAPYEMGDEDFVECGYCDRRFVLRGSKSDPKA
jgi:hypothetical protein